MNHHLQRARILIEQSRLELAEKEIRGALAQEPSNAEAHALLGFCLVQSRKYDEASREAQLAVHLAPDQSYMHYVHSLVLEGLNQHRESKAAVETAIGLNPYDPNCFAQLGEIEFILGNWKAAEAAANEGLELDPERVRCTNLRARALVKQGRNREAQASIQSTLERSPDNAYSHANMGWSYLEKNESEKALEHFKEAMRLEPGMEWARQGIVEAMKSRYFIYRWIFNWFLWTSKLRGRASFAIIMGGYFGYIVLMRVAANNPALAPFIYPLLVVYATFAVLTWLSSPLFNLVLCTSRFGRLALSKNEIRTSTWVGVCVVMAAGLLIHFAFTRFVESFFGGMCFILIVPPLSRIYDCDEGWPRNTLALITIGMMGTGAIVVASMVLGAFLAGEVGKVLAGIGVLLFLPLAVCSVITQFATSYFVSARPKKTQSKGQMLWVLGWIGLCIMWLGMIGFTALLVTITALKNTPAVGVAP